jgi:hypothetical protein
VTYSSGCEGRLFYLGTIKILEDTIKQFKDDFKNANKHNADNELQIIRLRAQLILSQQVQGNANADIASLTEKINDIWIDLGELTPRNQQKCGKIWKITTAIVIIIIVISCNGLLFYLLHFSLYG